MARKGLVIVVSGLPGAGSTTIAKVLARRFKLKFFSPGFIQKGLAKKERSESLASLKAWKTKTCKSRTFHKMLDREQTEMAKAGGVVISSKLGVHFLPQADLRVWLDVSLQVRAARSAHRDKIPLKEAKQALMLRETTERKEWKRIYGFDYFEQKKEADLVFDSSNLTIEQTIKKILEFIQKRDIRP